MSYIPITPFRGTVTAALIEHEKQGSQAQARQECVNKYDLMRELTAARASLGLGHRSLAVLQALLSFFPKADLHPQAGQQTVIVFPSNSAICERLNGMPCSTMRRHLASLVAAGLILRRDSPNGKRFVKRGVDGQGGQGQAFGFDLTPLVSRFGEFTRLATLARAEQATRDRTRRNLILMRRDLAAFVEYATLSDCTALDWEGFSALALETSLSLRRKLSPEEMAEIQTALRKALDQITTFFALPETSEMSTKDRENEQHHQDSNKDESQGSGPPSSRPQNHSTPVPLQMVLEACKEITSYTPHRIQSWQELFNLALTLRPMMGISPAVWSKACGTMGQDQAAVVLAVMLERFAEIRSPNAYLTALTRKAGQGRFSSIPMLATLIKSRVHSCELLDNAEKSSQL